MHLQNPDQPSGRRVNAKAFPGQPQQLALPAPAQPKRGDKGKGRQAKAKTRTRTSLLLTNQPRPPTGTLRKFKVMAHSSPVSREGRGDCFRLQLSRPCTSTSCTYDHSCAGYGKHDIPYHLCGCADHAARDDIPRCSDDAQLTHPAPAVVHSRQVCRRHVPLPREVLERRF